MKAIYTKIGSKFYKVKQNLHIPTDVTFKAPGVTSNVTIDPVQKDVTQFLAINDLPTIGVKTNAQMFKEMKTELSESQITEIDTIEDFYKVFIDYSLMVGNKECERAQVIRPIMPKDKIYILGTATNNENVYRQVKTFDPMIDFKLRAPMPHGIIDKAVGSCTLLINDISIYQSKRECINFHKSIYEVSFANSITPETQIRDDIKIYSTSAAGISINPIDLRFVPRKISVRFDVILTNYIVAYNENSVIDVLLENINKKYAHDTETDVQDPDLDDNGVIDTDQILIPDGEAMHEADGSIEPDENGYYDWYERCNSTTPNALLVVEDLLSDALYDNTKMIHKFMVIKDIPDISVGEFVVYRESITEGNHTGTDDDLEPIIDGE